VGVAASRRALDVVVSVTGLVLLAPLMLLLALVVRLSSPGPALFRQRRVGSGRREFTMLKFRTMRVTHGGSEITARGDPRVTGVGALLRGTSLDELPQLLNVLRGEMTLVGPRPETPALAARYPEDCRWVLDHRPGITGPTQVRLRDVEALSGGADDTERWYLEVLVPRRVALDATYLDRPTLLATLVVLKDTALHLLGRPTPRARPAG